MWFAAKDWFWYSIASVFLLVPAWLSIQFFSRNYNVHTNTFLVWYFAGIILATVATSTAVALVPSIAIVGAIMLVGVVFGAGANILLFKAIPLAPNPGLPVAISGSASLGVFLVSILLGVFFPKYFAHTDFTAPSFFGILFIIAGVALIAFKQ